MPNDHQRFTGINMNGPGHHGQGLWKSLCGDASDDIATVFCGVMGRAPTDPELGHARWLLGASLWYGEAIKCPTLGDYEAWLRDEYAVDEIDPPQDIQDGLSHDWHTATATWLYPGNREFWLASQRIMTWGNDKIDRYLRQEEIATHSTHVIICCSTGIRPEMEETTFDALKNEDRVREVFERVIYRHGKAPIAWLMSQEFFYQQLGASHTKACDQLKATAEMVRDLCNFAVPMRELGDVYGGSDMKTRNDFFRAMRAGAPQLPVACHERALEQIPVDDFAGVDGDVISLLQTGFDTPTGGQNRAEDRVTGGNHSYDGAAGFVSENSMRMANWQASGRLERHTNAVGEHSIPDVYAGQPWRPTRTLDNARKRGKILLEHGAAFDLSAGATR